MQPFSRILVPHDLSEEAERAVPVATALATAAGAPVVLLAWAYDEKEAAAMQRELAAKASSLGVPSEAFGRVSDEANAAPCILAVADEQPGTVICMGTRGRTGLGAALLGSTAEAVLRDATVPVVLAGRNARPQTALAGTVVAAVDGSPLAESGGRVAARFARALDLDLQVLHVLTPGAMTGGSADAFPDVIESGYLARLAGELGGERETSWEVIHDASPADAICSWAEEGAALLVVATHGRGGVSRVVLGSVAMTVVRNAPCPVVVVPPRLAEATPGRGAPVRGG